MWENLLQIKIYLTKSMLLQKSMDVTSRYFHLLVSFTSGKITPEILNSFWKITIYFSFESPLRYSRFITFSAYSGTEMDLMATETTHPKNVCPIVNLWMLNQDISSIARSWSDEYSDCSSDQLLSHHKLRMLNPLFSLDFP